MLTFVLYSTVPISFECIGRKHTRGEEGELVINLYIPLNSKAKMALGRRQHINNMRKTIATTILALSSYRPAP
jgi:hypothetical protein